MEPQPPSKVFTLLDDICFYFFGFLYPRPDFTVLLPKPPGPYAVASRHLHLSDPSRPAGPFVPGAIPNSTTPTRHISLKIFYPSGPYTKYPPPYLTKYLTHETNPTFRAQFPFLRDTIHKDAIIDTPCDGRGIDMLKHDLDGKEEAFPLLLFSAGAGIMRFMYTNIAIALASRGYIVAVMGETAREELKGISSIEDGSMLYSSGSRAEEEKEKSAPIWAESMEDAERALETRARDATFVLNELKRMELFPKIKRGDNEKEANDSGGLNGRKVGIVGHLLGGSTAAFTMRQDARFSAGASMDGIFPKKATSKALDADHGNAHPFLIIKSHLNTTLLDNANNSYNNFRERTPSLWKKEIVVERAKSMDWTDFPMLWEKMGVWDKVPEDMREGHGTIEPDRMLEIQTEYLGGFFDFALKGLGVVLFEGRGDKFPEVEVVG